jgi:pimeloyl-ACP methyl ester carboxylesterase
MLVLDALSPQRRRLILAAGGLALLLIMTVAVIAIARVAAPPAEPVPQTPPGPVLLVPGYGGDINSLQPLATALRSAGRTAIIVEPIGDGTGDLREQAEHLAEVAVQVRNDAGSASVDVVGYSAGGVVTRLWVRDNGGVEVARRILTLGSPHHGTSQAALGAEFVGGCSAACEQLIPDSDLLRRLNAGDRPATRWSLRPSPPHCLGLSISSSRRCARLPTQLTAISRAIRLFWQPSVQF